MPSWAFVVEMFERERTTVSVVPLKSPRWFESDMKLLSRHERLSELITDGEDMTLPPFWPLNPAWTSWSPDAAAPR